MTLGEFSNARIFGQLERPSVKKPEFEDPRNQWKAEIVFFINLILITLCLNGVWAEEDKEKERTIELGEVVVTATRMDAPRHEVADNITIISADDIQKLPVSNAAEILRYVPGLYVEFNGGLGSQATATMQGSETRHVAVYQDGVPLNQLANPQTDLSYLPIDAIEKIEIIKGAASSSWGSSLGGVINVITKKPDPKKPFAADVQTLYGEHGTFKGRGTISGSMDRFGFLVSVTEDESDGFMDFTKYRQEAVYTKVQYELGDTSLLDFVYSYDEGQNEYPVIDPADIWDDTYLRRTYQRLLFESSPIDGLDLTIESRHHHFTSNIDDVSRIDGSRSPYYDYSEETWGVSCRMAYDSKSKNRFNLGFDGDWGEYEFSSYSEKYACGNWAVYTNDSLNLEKFSFNVGVRYDHNRDFGSELSPSFGVVYRMSGKDALVRAKVSRGFSVPNAAWVNDPTYGNRDLKPEIGVNYQLGCELRFLRPLKVELNSFWADIKDLIQYDWDISTYKNVAKTTRRGVEARISTTFDSGLSFSVGGSFIDIRDEDNDDIKDLPTTLYDVSATYTYNRVVQSLSGKYVCNNSSFPETRDRVFIFDYLIRAQLPFPDRYGRIGLYGAVYNLFNSTYVYREAFPQPDRWIEAGLNVKY